MVKPHHQYSTSSSRSHGSYLLSAAVAAALISSGVMAQETSGQPQDTLAEVVVTAEKRSSTVQDVPLSVTAYGGDQLLRKGIVDLAQVAQMTPGVSLRDSGPGQTEYEMRGISSSGGESPTVGFYLDDTPLTAPAYTQTGKVAIDPALYDLNRVEILRGPQGTLYGAGSMGGTIKLVTNKPDPSSFDVSGQAIGSSTDGGGGVNYTGNAMINIPLVSGVVALRLVGTSEHIDGWIDRDVPQQFPQPTSNGTVRGPVLGAPVAQNFEHSNSEWLHGGRASLLIRPNDRLTITPQLLYQRITQDGPNYADSPPGVGYETHYQPLNVPEPFSDSFSLSSLVVKYEFDSFDLTSSTGYYTRAQHLASDSTEPVQDFFETTLAVPSPSYASVGALATFDDDWTKQESEEIRLTSTRPGSFQWLVGLFAEDFGSNDLLSTNAPGPLVSQTFGIPLLYNVEQIANLHQYAVFGNASYKFASGFRLTTGLRYFKYKASDSLSEAGGLPNGSLTPSVFQGPASDSGNTPMVNLSYLAHKNLTLYVQAAKGFRPGATNTPPPATCPQDVVPLQYHPDSLWSYEAGEKARAFDGRMTVNSAAYYERWAGIQQLISLPCGFFYTANAGVARVYGGEVELSALITPRITLSTSLGYTDARIAETAPGSSFYVGEKIQEVPDFTNTTSLSFRHPIGNNYQFVAMASNEYVGSSTDVTYFVNNVPSRDIVNGRVGLEAAGGMDLYLFVDNLTDKRAILGNVPAQSFNVPIFNRVATNQPRTIGLDLTYEFGRTEGGK